MSTAPRQRHAAKRSDTPLHAPAAGDTHAGATGGWPDSPRQLKQITHITQLQAVDPPAASHPGGLPDGLRRGIESLSGMDMSGVRVHRNSGKAATLGARAYAQGTNIHLGPGQEKHLAHEAWHVVQQHQGRVAPTHQVAGVAVNGDAGLEREADAMGSRAMSIAQRVVRPSTQVAAQRQAVAQCAADEVAQLSIMSRYRWGAYFAGLPNNQVRCDAIDTGEARTTMETTVNAHGETTHRVIRLHAYTNDAWGEVGTVTMDRARVPQIGPVPHGAPPLPPRYDDSELTLHTAAAGGAGNAGVATHLFPAVLSWIDRNLRGVQQLNMNPAGGAASKSVIADLGAHLGEPVDHAHANAARAARKNAETLARQAAALGGPAVVGIGSGAGAMALNTWDTRLNTEHAHDLRSLDASPHAGLTITGDGMSLAGPALPGDIAALQGRRDFFANTLAPLAPPHPVINALHPAYAHFQAAAALTNVAIAADPRSAAVILRMALLSSRSGATGTGGGVDAGYQITLGGAALQHLMPNATQ